MATRNHAICWPEFPQLVEITQAVVTAHFDREAEQGRRLLPDRNSVSGLGSHVKYERAATLMADSSVRRALDVGCNRGSIEFLFRSLYPAKAAATAVEGIDVSTTAIRQACELGLANCHFQPYDGLQFPYPSAGFDLVILVEVLEHVPEKERLLREAWRVLRPGGRLFLTTPNPDCWALRAELQIWRALRMFLRREPIAKDEFVTHVALEQLLSRVGFARIEAGPMYSWPHVFLYFRGWSILPPLPPRALYSYQKLCVRYLEDERLPSWLSRRLKWSLVTLAEKKAHW